MDIFKNAKHHVPPRMGAPQALLEYATYGGHGGLEATHATSHGSDSGLKTLRGPGSTSYHLVWVQLRLAILHRIWGLEGAWQQLMQPRMEAAQA